MGLQKVLSLSHKIESRGYMLRESILEVNAALNTLEAQAVEHPQFQEVRNIVYFLKRDLLMLSRRLGFYDLELVESDYGILNDDERVDLKWLN